MLPEVIGTCCVRYKAYGSATLGWVVSVSNGCGYKVSKPSNHRCSITPGSTAPNATKYTIPRTEILPRVEQNLNCTKPTVEVPTYVLNYLKESIADRETCSSWFQEYLAGDTSVGKSTDAHLHFTELLKTMLSMLMTIASNTTDPSQPHGLHRISH